MAQGKFEDLKGKKFGKLTVLFRAPDYIQPSGQHKRMWHCKCDCGNECDIRANDLKSGNTSSCGCFQQFSRGKSSFEDLTGKRFGKLLVLRRLPDHITPSGQKQRMWYCKCDCGNECTVYATQLKNGRNNCGCLSLVKKAEKEQEKQKIEEERKLREIERQKQKAEKEALKLEKAKLKETYKEQSVKIRKEKNSVANRYPHILEEWDYEKNSISPYDISPTSPIIVWWKCPSGLHSYEMRIDVRTKPKSSGCPYCSIPARRVLKGFNDLATKHPELLAEWDYSRNGNISPDNVLSGSGQKVWWVCKKGHSYDQHIVNRANGAGCPYCSHQKMLKGYSDLATTNPELLSEWDYEKNDYLPSEISVGVHKKIWWKCPFGHSYQSYPYNRCGHMHSGCPICDKENHTSFPEQALYFYILRYFPDAINSDKTAIGMELDIFIPSHKIAIEYDGKKWHKNNKYELKKNHECKKNNILLMRIREDGLELYDDCYCIVRENVKSNLSLTNVIKQVLFDIDNILDTDVDVERDSAKIYASYIKSRKEKSLLNAYPEIAKEWHSEKNGNLTSEMVSPSSNKIVWWLGKCGHEFKMSISNRTSQNCSCPYCSGKRILKGYNDFETWCIKNNRDDILKEWDYTHNTILPFEVTKSSDKQIYWKCTKCSHIWRAKLDHRTRVGSGCPECDVVNKPKKVKCIETNTIYSRIQEASEKTGINRHCIGNCCSGKQKTAGGYHWKYVK